MRRSWLIVGLLASIPSESRRAPPTNQNPLIEHALQPLQQRWLDGVVEDRLSAGHYVYLRLRHTDGTKTWLVSLETTTPKTTAVRALVIGSAERFHSRRLRRDFSP
ncbi:MAG TPA: hypothetical protein VMF89_16545, partial [Polyangiales bacterium]|nr:hypothetical protein [Polyangiales bacterium]